MIILEGKNGKSQVIEDMVNNRLMNDKVVILDTVGLNFFSKRKGIVHYQFARYSYEDILKDLKGNQTLVGDFEWVIMYFNIPELDFDVDWFKDLDRESTKNFLVTVQTNEKIKMKFA